MRCPHLGTPEEKSHCKRPCRNISGLKKHLTRTHGGWSEEQITSAIASEPSQPLPSETEPMFIGESGVEQFPPNEEPKERKTRSDSKQRKASKELQDALTGVKEEFCTLLPIMTAGFFESKLGISGTLSESASEKVSRLWSAYISMLGFELETDVEPTKVKVKGKVLKFLMPFAIALYTLGVMTGVHKIDITKPEAEIKPQAEPIYVPEAPKEETDGTEE